MPTLRFEGASDDTFGEYAHTRDDYDNCASGKPIDWLVTAPGVPGGLIVTGQYGREANADVSMSWQIGVAAHDPDNTDAPLPPWPMRIERSERPYSPSLVIEVPDGVQVRCLQRRLGEDA